MVIGICCTGRVYRLTAGAEAVWLCERRASGVFVVQTGSRVFFYFSDIDSLDLLDIDLLLTFRSHHFFLVGIKRKN